MSDVTSTHHSSCVQQNEEATCLGTPLTVADAAYVFCSSQLSTQEEGDSLLSSSSQCSVSLALTSLFLSGKIIFFSEGLLFVHSQYGSITVAKHHVSSIKFYDPVTVTAPWILNQMLLS